MRKVLRVAGGVAIVLAVLLTAAAGWFWWQLRDSLPVYDGELALEGLTAPVIVERDALGVVTIRSEHLLDEARALGFVHGQERFFQMDMGRRSSAGELAALLGEGAAAADEQARPLLRREAADLAVGELSDDNRALLDAYVAGVNAGLAALGAKPFEYLLLRSEPEPWSIADTLLRVDPFFLDAVSRKRHEYVARGLLPAEIADLLYPTATVWDAPLIGDPGPPATIPSADVFDLRGRAVPRAADVVRIPPPAGSNNWAVAGSHTATGRALVANDSHMPLMVPSTFLRVSLERGGRRVTGVSLPPAPGVVVGSNGRVAWGFTVSYGDWTDFILLDLDPDDPTRYRAPDGWHDFEIVSSRIEVARGNPREITIRQTIWGPVLGELPDGTPYVVREARDAGRPDLDPGPLASAGNALEAARAVQRWGHGAGQGLNFVVGDAEGHVAWTVIGPIPRRVRHGLVSRSSTGPAWDGWLDPEEFPLVVDPPGGRIWTANGRVVDGDMLATMGDGGYVLGARGGQIRDRLMAIDRATPADMLRVQLDDEARLLVHWHDELLRVLDDVTDPLRVAARDAVREWGGHASIDSVGFRLIWNWRIDLTTRMLPALAADVIAADPSWRYTEYWQSEQWAWPLVQEEPPHLLPPGFDSWRAFKLDTLDAGLARFGTTPAELARHPWGERNLVRVQHPLSEGFPLLSRWLNMPTAQLPGAEVIVPRVQSPVWGAAERFAVSPGDEANGYFHMPGGQSSHPLSPYYGAGHEDWEAGRAARFLPGPAQATLTLLPGIMGSKEP
jgi:penicillin amidase